MNKDGVGLSDTVRTEWSRRVEKSVPRLTLTLAFLWCLAGIWLFFINPSAIPDRWSAGELGDFFGGGLGGLAIIALAYTTWLSSRQFELQESQEKIQTQQLGIQQRDMEEAGVLRVYEALKPELEGISMRIISKAMKEDLVELRRQDFDVHAEKFQRGDRTVFLRQIQKLGVTDDLASNGNMHNDHSQASEAKKTIERFLDMVSTIDASLAKIEQRSSEPDDFCKGLRETEVFRCYEALKTRL